MKKIFVCILTGFLFSIPAQASLNVQVKPNTTDRWKAVGVPHQCGDLSIIEVRKIGSNQHSSFMKIDSRNILTLEHSNLKEPVIETNLDGEWARWQVASVPEFLVLVEFLIKKHNGESPHQSTVCVQEYLTKKNFH